MPDAAAVHEFGNLPLPVLGILALVALLLGSVYIITKFSDGSRRSTKTEDFEVKLATFDPRRIDTLNMQLERNVDASEKLVEALGRNTESIKELAEEISDHKVEMIRSSARGG